MMLSLFVPLALAQATNEPLVESGVKLEPIQISPAVIDVNDRMEVGRGSIFDASLSTLPEEGKFIYEWDFGDGNRDQGIEAVHSYAEPGPYTVSLDIEVDGQFYAHVEKSLFVYRQLYLLITDQATEREKIESMVSFARDRGVFMEVVSNYEANSEFIVEEDLLKKLNEALPSVKIADAIIIWTDGGSGLAVLSRFNQRLTDATNFYDKEFVVITNQSLIDLQWVGFWNRSSTRIEYHTIEGVTYEVNGFWAVIMNYGDISIERLGVGQPIGLKAVSFPKSVEREILNAQNEFMRNKNFRDHQSLKDLLSNMMSDYANFK